METGLLDSIYKNFTFIIIKTFFLYVISVKTVDQFLYNDKFLSYSFTDIEEHGRDKNFTMYCQIADGLFLQCFASLNYFCCERWRANTPRIVAT